MSRIPQVQLTLSRRRRFTGPLLLSLILPWSIASCERFGTQEVATGESPDAQASSEREMPPSAPEAPERREWALVVHGGFASSGSNEDTNRVAGLRQFADAAAARLAAGEAALQVVVELVAQLEEDPRFNAGRGSTFNRRGVHEMSAALMDGRTRAFGAIGGLRNVRSPIAAARAALQSHQGGPLLANSADSFSRTLALPRAPQDSFTTPERFAAWRSFRQEARRREREGATLPAPIDPVGALALDSFGNLAAAVSFGGYTDAAPEQPLAISSVGPGIYADNRGAAALAVGPEDRLLSCQFPAAVATTMVHTDEEPTSVLAEAASGCPGGGPLGLLAIDRWGRIAILRPESGASLIVRTAEAGPASDSSDDLNPAPADDG